MVAWKGIDARSKEDLLLALYIAAGRLATVESISSSGVAADPQEKLSVLGDLLYDAKLLEYKGYILSEINEFLEKCCA